MADLFGKLEAETKVKSNADKFWGAIRDFVTVFPKVSPTDYKSIQILEGDGKVACSVYKTISGGEEGDDNGSLVKWSGEYEKASQDVPEPTFMREAAINMFLKLDDYILNA
ncbi:hypothetical protein PIB30_007948 [Stylosanthes scabra]|uniref:Bet v I/Major latex protein domain-containing protein n=1 Tax=Stylosanthes scabra TaxID=79078 RepID=A0ABU6T5P8_9FABA|nr:hypothetical protein [Stylosanthes scabra]